jgi:hypothetical protein
MYGELSQHLGRARAALVEYALVLVTIVMVTAKVTALLTSTSTDYQSQTASEIGREQVYLPNTDVCLT